LFNRGNELKKSLIDASKVKEFIERHQTCEGFGDAGNGNSRKVEIKQ